MNTKSFIERLKNDRRSVVKDFFNIIETCSLENYVDILKASYTVYESGIAFQPVIQPYKNWEYHKLCENIAHIVFKYLNLDLGIESFDTFHDTLCKLFIDMSDCRYTYGNAQKFVNMLFKYLACFRDVKYYENKFENCHIPLDSHILKTLSKDGIDICKNRSWIKLDRSTYLEIVKSYRNKLNITNGLEYDFNVWN